MLARRPNLAHFTNCIFPQFTCEVHSGTPNWPEGCYSNRASLIVTHFVGLDQSGASELPQFSPWKTEPNFSILTFLSTCFAPKSENTRIGN